MKADLSKRGDKAKQKDTKCRETPDIVVKVNCRYRAELFFKISRKTKFSRLISSWTERMERAGGKSGDTKDTGSKSGFAQSETASTQHSGSPLGNSSMQFIFTFNGRSIETDQTFEEIGIDDDDEILAVELMDLTEGGGGSEEWVRIQSLDMIRRVLFLKFLQEEHVEPQREKLKKNWTKDPQECATFGYAFFCAILI